MMHMPPMVLQDVLNRNDKSEHITNSDDAVRIIIDWSEWRDLNCSRQENSCKLQTRNRLFSRYLPDFQ